jgi:magnesium-transporting ATPase (P-type)
MRSREQPTTTGSTTVRAALLSTPTDFDKLVVPINPITEPAAAAAVDLDADRAAFPDGLTSAEAARRLVRFGPNALPEEERQEWRVLLSKFWGPMPVMIWLAIAVEAVQASWVDFGVLLTLQVLNGGVSYYEEKNAGDAIAALKQRMTPSCVCRRDGTWDADFDTAALVPGDLVRLKLGDIVPADVTLGGGDQSGGQAGGRGGHASSMLEIDQAALTGESLPVTMFAGDVAKMGSTVKRGELDARVAFTGGATFFGKAAGLMAGVVTQGRFQRVLFKITMFLLLLSSVLVTVILAVLIEADFSALKAVGIAVVLLVASIPIAMQVVSTSTMAVGSRALATRSSVIVAKLSAIEELAGMDMLCSDKTGTLTQNKLTLFEPIFPADSNGGGKGGGVKGGGKGGGGKGGATPALTLAERERRLYRLAALSCKAENFAQQHEEVTKAGIVDFSTLEEDKQAVAAGGSSSSSSKAAGAGPDVVAVATEVKQTLDAIDWCIYKRVMARDRAGYDGFAERRHHPFDPSNKRTEGKVVCTATGECMWVMKGAPQVVLDLALRSCSNGARAALAAEVGASIQVLLLILATDCCFLVLLVLLYLLTCTLGLTTSLHLWRPPPPGPGGPRLSRAGRRARARAGHRLQRRRRRQQQQQQQQQQQSRRQPRRRR